jgi:hypothetical protein
MAELEDLPDDYMDPIPGVDDGSAAEWGPVEIMPEAAAETEARGEPLVDPGTGEPRIPGGGAAGASGALRAARTGEPVNWKVRRPRRMRVRGSSGRASIAGMVCTRARSRLTTPRPTR